VASVATSRLRGCLESLGLALIGFLGGSVLVFFIGSWAVESTTTEHVIPPSCREPSSIDYSEVGRPDLGPYVVKFKSWKRLPWGEERSSVVIGHDSADYSDLDVGHGVNIYSTDIAAFRCRWSDKGVTIIEPGDKGRQVEHFVPAWLFLGGR
jgi:hypothetical protein